MSAPEAGAGGGALLTVERGLRVLRAFRSDRTPVGNAELVRRTGLSKATVSRLTSTLLEVGFLRQVAGGRQFELAPGALAMGHAYLATSELLQRANPFLQELADRLNVSVALAIGDGLDMLYIGYKAGQRVATLRLGVGTVLPMDCTAVGHAYLWASPAPERKRLLAELRRRAGGRADTMEQDIAESFSELEQTGVCGVFGKYQRDVYAVALPVVVGTRKTVMGLSCGKASVRPDLAAERKRIAPVLKKAAVEFEALLAGFEGQP